MNDGSSQIYSLLINEFPIEDSRVASAMCLHDRKYCEERDLSEVPVQLAFGLL